MTFNNVDNLNLKDKIAKIAWWHRIDLGNGLVTPGRCNNFLALKKIHLPPNLKDKTVLDIGAWDGFYSFESEKRGAKRVLATDSFVWQKKGLEGKSSKDGFNLARKILKSKVDDLEIEVLDLSPEKIGQFDLVLFLGVLYHMRHPLLALEKVYSVTKDMLILETHVDLISSKYPAMRFYPRKELRKDMTNWWGPNPSAVKAMLKDVGFKKVKLKAKYFTFPTNIALATYFKFKKIQPFFETTQQGRAVFHAWK